MRDEPVDAETRYQAFTSEVRTPSSACDRGAQGTLPLHQRARRLFKIRRSQSGGEVAMNRDRGGELSTVALHAARQIVHLQLEKLLETVCNGVTSEEKCSPRASLQRSAGLRGVMRNFDSQAVYPLALCRRVVQLVSPG